LILSLREKVLKVKFPLLVFMGTLLGFFGNGEAGAHEKRSGPQAGSFWQMDLEELALISKRKIGWASWYGGRFHGRKTANGERYNKHAFTCASKTLPFGTILEITNLKNGRSADCRVNDRGPYRKRRILDVSYAVAKKLGFVRSGVAKVAFQIISHPR